jgi:hypothetical protein
MRTRKAYLAFTGVLALGFVTACGNDHDSFFFFTTGSPDGAIAFGSRTADASRVEIEAADDFQLSRHTKITEATFTGLLPDGAPTSTIAEVAVEIYHVFPADSANPPSGRVPSRTNSPADNALDDRNSLENTLGFAAEVTQLHFSAANSVLNGIHPSPNQTTGGEGPARGEEVKFTVTFDPPFDLPADHYFFVPQVRLTSGEFLWLSAPKPVFVKGKPLATDLQAWIRNSDLDPDWLRIGTDIVGGNPPPTFNGAFSVSGEIVD